MSDTRTGHEIVAGATEEGLWCYVSHIIHGGSRMKLTRTQEEFLIQIGLNALIELGMLQLVQADKDSKAVEAMQQMKPVRKRRKVSLKKQAVAAAKKHWTQTPAGKRKMSRLMKQRHAEKSNGQIVIPVAETGDRLQMEAEG